MTKIRPVYIAYAVSQLIGATALLLSDNLPPGLGGALFALCVIAGGLIPVLWAFHDNRKKEQP